MRTVLILILRAAGNSGNVCLGPSLRNHGLITGWEFLCVLSSFMETIVVRVLSDSWFLPCQGSALTRLSYGPTCERLCIHSTGGGQFRQRLALSPSTRNHGLITGWKIIGVLSNRRETIASSNWTRNLISTVSR